MLEIYEDSGTHVFKTKEEFILTCCRYVADLDKFMLAVGDLNFADNLGYMDLERGDLIQIANKLLEIANA